MGQLRVRLSGTAAMISREIDANKLRDIRSERDVVKRDYLEALESLRHMCESNEDVSFLYVMRRDDDGLVRFVVDSDTSEDQAKPGLIYEAVNPALLRGFDEQAADMEFVTDAWGTFFSGYAPILNGKGKYLIGIDMRADEVRAKLMGIQRAGGLALLAAVVFSWLIATWMSQHFREPIEAMIAQCQAISAGDLSQRLEMQRHDEMDSLLTAINLMTEDLKKAREDNVRLAESLDDALDEDPRGKGNSTI